MGENGEGRLLDPWASSPGSDGHVCRKEDVQVIWRASTAGSKRSLPRYKRSGPGREGGHLRSAPIISALSICSHYFPMVGGRKDKGMSGLGWKGFPVKFK